MATFYRDLDYDGFVGGGIPETSKIDPTIIPPLKKINFMINENDQYKVVELKVEPHGSFNVKKLSQTAEIVSLKRLYSLSKNIEEFNHLSMLFNQTFKGKKQGIPNPLRYSIESFSALILAIKEINNIIPNEIDIMKINSILHLEEYFIKNKKYLYFSSDPDWKEFIIGATIEVGKFRIKPLNRNGFISANFTLAEIKSSIKKRIDLQGSTLERVASIVHSDFDFNILIDKLTIYFKNQALLKEFGIDFDKIDIKKKDDVSDFLLKVNNVSSYKIFNKLMQRLNAEQREIIKSNQIIFNSFLAFANKMNCENLNFNQIEPILKRVHTYSNVNVLLNGLYGIVSEFSIYNITETCKELDGAEICYFNESDQVAIIRIKKYKAMQKLGSPSWCVQHISEKFDQYTRGLRRFYIFVDAKSKYKSDSKIGFTIALNGKVVEACNLENRSIVNYLDESFYNKYGKHMRGFLFKDAKPKR